MEEREQEKGGETMLKKIAKFIRKFQLLQQKKRHHQRWAKLLKSGCTMRDTQTEKSDRRTQVIVADDGIRVDYMDGRMVGQRYVEPVYIDSTRWGVGN
jgi:hypothetical protein